MSAISAGLYPSCSSRRRRAIWWRLWRCLSLMPILRAPEHDDGGGGGGGGGDGVGNVLKVGVFRPMKQKVKIIVSTSIEVIATRVNVHTHYMITYKYKQREQLRCARVCVRACTVGECVCRGCVSVRVCAYVCEGWVPSRTP